MITNRSNHMPMLTKMQRTKITTGLRRTRLRPEELRDEHVAAHHREVGPPERTERAVDERELLVQVPRVPGDEELGRVGETDHHARRQHDLAHRLDVLLLDDVLEVEQVPQRQHQRQHHREAGEDGAGDEVRREDRRVPARELRGREVERDDRVDREHQRRREAREDQVGALVAVPLAGRAAPAEAERAVDDRLELVAAAPRSGRGTSRGREPCPCTRTGSTWSRRSRPRTRPTSAGCGTAATCPCRSGAGASTTRTTDGRCGAAGTDRRT